LKIYIFNEESDYKYKKKRRIKNIIAEIENTEQIKFTDISIIFCSDEYLRKINKEYLKRDYYTDIITFAFNNKETSGDLYISIERVFENANIYKVNRDNEINRVIIHGLLHLCGYDDNNLKNRKKMREKENYYLNFIV